MWLHLRIVIRRRSYWLCAYVTWDPRMFPLGSIGWCSGHWVVHIEMLGEVPSYPITHPRSFGADLGSYICAMCYSVYFVDTSQLESSKKWIKHWSLVGYACWCWNWSSNSFIARHSVALCFVENRLAWDFPPGYMQCYALDRCLSWEFAAMWLVMAIQYAKRIGVTISFLGSQVYTLSILVKHGRNFSWLLESSWQLRTHRISLFSLLDHMVSGPFWSLRNIRVLKQLLEGTLLEHSPTSSRPHFVSLVCSFSLIQELITR